MNNSLSFILKRLLKEHSIKVDEKELEFQLLSHPSYPSLHSLTGVLDHFRIENMVLQVPTDEATLQQLPDAFIAYLKDSDHDDLVLVKKHESQVQLVFDKTKKENISQQEFLKLWTGIIVGIEKDENIPMVQTNKGSILNKGIAILSFITLLIFFIYLKPDIFPSIHFILAIAGLMMSTVIVKHELGLQSAIADKFCSGKSESISCDDVLESKGSKFFNLWGLSDIGIIYFSSVLLSWLFLLANQSSYQLMLLITASAVPFTIYSISYQFFIIKKWCLLCLSIVSVLWLQAFGLYFTNIETLDFSSLSDSIIPISLSFLLCFSLWQFIIRKLRREKELNENLTKHNRFKRNYKIFHSLISGTKTIDTHISNIQEISIERESPLVEVIIVTNPLCGFCKETHQLAEKLIELKNDNIRVTIRFNVSLKPDYPDTQIAQRLLELYHIEGENKCLTAMGDIYGALAPKEWLLKWGHTNDHSYLNILEKQKKWCSEQKIEFTPEILVNGKSFPLEYDRSDLLYFIDDIVEDYQPVIECSVS